MQALLGERNGMEREALLLALEHIPAFRGPWPWRLESMSCFLGVICCKVLMRAAQGLVSQSSKQSEGELLNKESVMFFVYFRCEMYRSSWTGLITWHT